MSKPFHLPWHKRIFKHPRFQDAATWLIALGLRLCSHTFRTSLDIHPEALTYMHGERNAIFCFWHGRMIVFPLVSPKSPPMHVLISHHRDGELIAKVVRHFGIDSIRGSSSNGAKSATRSLLAVLESGANVSITPDGPRGPAQQAAAGAIMLSRLSKKPLIPCSYSASFCKRLRSWDRFMIPLPFSRIVIQIGAPFYVEKHEDKEATEEVRRQLENQLNQLTRDADARTHIV